MTMEFDGNGWDLLYHDHCASIGQWLYRCMRSSPVSLAVRALMRELDGTSYPHGRSRAQWDTTVMMALENIGRYQPHPVPLQGVFGTRLPNPSWRCC